MVELQHAQAGPTQQRLEVSLLQRRGMGGRCRLGVGQGESGGKLDPRTRLDWAAQDRIVAGQGLCGRDRIRTCVGNAGDFTGRLAVASPVPSRPHMTPTIGRDVRKRQVDSFSRPSASLPVSPRPGGPGVGRREDGGKAAALPPPCGPEGSPPAAAAHQNADKGVQALALPEMLAGLPEDREGSLELIGAPAKDAPSMQVPRDCRGSSPRHCDHRHPELRAERGPGAPPVPQWSAQPG
jgi:hypothetical protein